MEKTLLLENIINKINKNVEDIKTKLMQLESKLYNDVNFDYKTVLYFTNILTEINETLSILSSLLIEFINIYKTNDIMQEFSKTVELKITELKDKILILETRLDNFKQLTNKSIYDVKETIENIESQIEMFEKDFKQTIQLIDETFNNYKIEIQQEINIIHERTNELNEIIAQLQETIAIMRKKVENKKSKDKFKQIIIIMLLSSSGIVGLALKIILEYLLNKK